MKNALVLLLLSVGLAGCGQEFSQRATADLHVSFSHEPNPARVGDNTLRVRITDRAGQSISLSEVRFHYYPFVFRVKDSLASPDEVVLVTNASPDQDGYSARVNFEKSGPWKITVKIMRPEKPDTVPTFTLDVRG